MMKFLAGVIATTALLLAGFFVGQTYFLPAPVKTAPLAGNFNTTGGGTYNLQATITSSQTTINLSSFLEPQSNIAYTMSYLNSSIEYATIAPQTSQSEFVSFTGITQNSDGSATLTGVQRGLDRSYPYTASSTLALPHAGQSRFILSNPPQVYNSYGALTNANTWSAVNTFSSTSPPTYDTDPVWANFSTQIFADVAYVNSVVAAGAANASETVKGIVQLATGAQAALGTSLGSTAARLAIPNSLATSTPYNSGSNVVPVTGTNEKLSQLFLDLTQNFTWSGGHTFNGFLTSNSTTTISNASLTNSAFVIHTVPYLFPSSQGIANSFLKNDGSGNLSWTIPSVTRYSRTDSSGVSASGASNPNLATSTGLVIPAGTLTASSTWTVTANVSTCTTSTTNCIFYLRDTAGTTFATCDFGNNSITGDVGFITFTGANQSSLSSQSTLVSGSVSAAGSTMKYCQNVGTATFNTANALTLVLVAQSSSGVISSIGQFSIVVNP